MNSKAIRKQLFAAVAMVLVAAVALGSSTYAWFVASGTVKATGMQVQIQAESGILIKEKDTDNAFATVANASGAAQALIPTSTNNLTAWYHNNSNDADAAKGGIPNNKYTTVGTGVKDDYYLQKTFAIRSATQNAIPNAKLGIKKVSVSDGTGSIQKALRVGIKLTAGGDTSQTFIYAPKRDAEWTLTNVVYATEAAPSPAAVELNAKQAPAGTATSSDCFNLTDTTIPANDTALTVDVFIWYEGEDDECKTTNITGLDPGAVTTEIIFEQVKAS